MEESVLTIAREPSDPNGPPDTIGSEIPINLSSKVNNLSNAEKTLDLLILDTESLFASINEMQNKSPKIDRTSVYNSSCKYLKNIFEAYVDFFVDCERFYDVNIFSVELDIIRGLGLIIKTVLLFLANKKLFLRHYFLISKRVQSRIFQQIKSTLLNSDHVSQSFFITSILIRAFHDDWAHFFYYVTPKIEYELSMEYIEDSNFEPMNEVLFHIFTKPPISTYFANKFCNSNIEALSVNLRLAIERVRIIPMNPSASGLVSYKMYIFIKEFGHFLLELKRGATVIVFFHEFSHFLRRVSCHSISEMKKNSTPEYEKKKKSVPFIEPVEPSCSKEAVENIEEFKKKVADELIEGSQSSDIEDIDETLLPKDIIKMLSLTEERFSKRGEAGFQTERELFGVFDQVEKLTRTASIFLLDYSNYPENLSEFINLFVEKNAASRGEPYIPVSRGSCKFTGVSCPMNPGYKFTYR